MARHFFMPYSTDALVNWRLYSLNIHLHYCLMDKNNTSTSLRVLQPHSFLIFMASQSINIHE